MHIWLFTSLGTYAPNDEDAGENGYVPIDCGYIKNMLVSAVTEGEAVAILRDTLNPMGEWYDATHWSLERIGKDIRVEWTPIINTTCES